MISIGLKTREEYLDSLRKMRPNIYKFGELVEDVTTHPATRRTVESHARGFDASFDMSLAEIFTTRSYLSDEITHRWNSLMRSKEDLINYCRMKREMYRLVGTCTGGLCVGCSSLNVMWAVASEMDSELETEYLNRLEKWLLKSEKEALVVAGALTDAKGDRSKSPVEQEEIDVTLRIIERRPDGIVIRGSKVMICGVAAANEIFILPGGAYDKANKDFAVSCVVPRDIEGLTIVETRRPSDRREYEEGFDLPETGITQSYLLFENVFVPNERVFMNGEYSYTGKIIQYFTSNYRACIGSCVAGQGDVMIGASVIMARANGISNKSFNDKITQMAINNETTYGLGIGAIAMGKAHSSGIWFADSLLAHTNKVHVGTLPYETKRLCQDIGGGVVETGCLPSYQDIYSLEYGAFLNRIIKAGPVSAETRARGARLSEWLTIGAGVPGCMHGGGSPDGAKIAVMAYTPIDKYMDYAKQIAGIKENIPEPFERKR